MLLDARAVGGVGGGAPLDATFITQTPNATLTNEQALSALATGILKSTTATGIVSIAAQGMDYYAPGGTDVAIADGGTGQSTAQAAIDALTNVAAATNEHVLTKDTGTGNAIFKAGGSSLPVADTQTIVMGSVDNTKLLRFEVDGFTPGTTRVLTPPNADATIAGLEVANVFTAIQKINVNSATAFLIEQDGVKDNVFVVDTTSGRVAIGAPAAMTLLHVGDQNSALSAITIETHTASAASIDFRADGANQGFFQLNASNRYQMGTYTANEFGMFTNSLERITISADGRVGVGEVLPDARLHVAQKSTTAAKPTLRLTQLDLSEELIRFDGVVAVGNPIEDVGAKTLTTTHFIRVSVNGVFLYIPAGTIA